MNNAPRKPTRTPSLHTLVAKRLEDLKGYVEFEAALPDDKQVHGGAMLQRIDAFVRSTLGEFKKANLERQLQPTPAC